eukprot:SAG31_NODE_346_length_17349_cov_9.825875_13_plen_121_part_00
MFLLTDLDLNAGLKHERLGEEVAVAVAVKSGMSIDGPELAKFTADRIARFKVPTRVFIWYVWSVSIRNTDLSTLYICICHRPGDLPRGATGKIPKRDLRDDVETGKTRGVVELSPNRSNL